MIRSVALAGFGLLSLAATPAQAADCVIASHVANPVNVVVPYDPFAASLTARDFSLRIETAGCSASRNVFLEIDPVDPSQIDNVQVRLTNGSATLLATLSRSPGGVPHGRDEFYNVTAGGQTFYVNIPRGQVVQPGEYRAAMIANARLSSGTREVPVAAAFAIVVQVGAAIGLVPVTGSRLDLGELADGRTAAEAMTFDAYANVPYTLTVRSDLGYVLRRGGVAGAAGPAYQPMLDGSALAGGALPARDYALPPMSLNRRRHALNARVPSIAGQAAGTYRDVLTVEISARLGE